MTKEDAITIFKRQKKLCLRENDWFHSLEMAIKALEQQPCEMTAEEYRQRMIQAFHNTDCDELIAMCVLPTEKEFEHLEWLLKNHYKKQPCDDAISRTDAIRVASGYCHWSNIPKELAKLPSVNTIPCGDAISRQAAIDAMATWDWQELYLPIHFKQLLEDLPSVCTEKTGRWEWVQYDSNPNIGNWHCSECNRIVCGAITEANPVYAYKYCPECGARMVEPQESEE